jgi:hypothetical protein
MRQAAQYESARVEAATDAANAELRQRVQQVESRQHVRERELVEKLQAMEETVSGTAKEALALEDIKIQLSEAEAKFAEAKIKLTEVRINECM